MSTTEMKVKHTPGPWRVQSRPNVCRVDVYGPKHADGGDYAPLVTFLDRSSLPNAHLIAAAPDMLEALEQTQTALRLSQAAPKLLSIVESAIAKARGGAA